MSPRLCDCPNLVLLFMWSNQEELTKRRYEKEIRRRWPPIYKVEKDDAELP